MPTPSTAVLPKSKSKEEFEIICRDLLADKYSMDFQQFGRNGQAQYGIDIYANYDEGLLIVAQCKNYFNLKAKKLIEELQKDYTAAYEKWGQKIERFYGMTALDRDATVQEAFMGQNKIAVMFWDDIQEAIASNNELYVKHYSSMPLPIQDSNTANVSKNNYDYPLDYISRSFVKLDYDRQHKTPLFIDNGGIVDVALNTNRVIVIGEAGLGKSTDLQYLAHKLSIDKEGVLYPVLIRLKDFLDTVEINSYIPNDYKELPDENIILIFDGYDEIEDRYKSNFVRKINNFTMCRPQVNVLISTRGNFYRNIHDRNGSGEGEFDGFSEYSISLLNNADINNYLNSMGIVIASFFDEANTKRLSELMHVPFYLIHMAEIYNDRGSLPYLNDMMEFLIKHRFHGDAIKNTTDVRLHDIENEIFEAFQKLALSMQLLSRNYLTNVEYQQLMPFADDRKHLAPNGFWEREGDNWRFKHANFQEYLVAKKLSTSNADGVLELIKTENNSLLNRWVNVLVFLIPMLSSDELLNWVIDNNPSLIVRFEIGKISSEQKFDIFTKIMQGYRERYVWLPYRGRDLELFARSFSSKKALELLMSEIASPKHFRAQSNAISVIMYFENFYNKEDEVVELLLNCCKNEDTRPYEREAAMYALGGIGANVISSTKHLLELFSKSSEPYEISGLCAFLLMTNQVDDNIDFFIDAIRQKGDDGYISKSFRIIEGLKQASQPDSIKKVLTYIALHKDENRWSYISDDLVDSSIVTSIKLHNEGHDEMFSLVFDALVFAIEMHEYGISKKFWRFFEETNTKSKAIKMILFSSDMLNRYFQHANLADEEYVHIYAEMYANGEKKQEFVWFAESLFDGDPLFDICRKAIKEVENRDISPREVIDFNKLDKLGKQKYFNSLFSKTDYMKLVDELLVVLGNNEATCKDLCDFRELYNHPQRELKWVRWDIKRLCSDDHCTKSIVSHFDKINWELYSLLKICRELKSEKELNVSDSQKEFLGKYCAENLVDFSFANDVQYKDDSYQYSYRGYLMSFFIQFFKFPCDKQNLRELLFYPYLFSRTANRGLYSSDVCTELIKELLGEQEIIEQVKLNVQKWLSP